MNKKMTTFAITLPLFFETLLRTLLMNVDTFMLSQYSDKAVAAVGTIQQFTFFVMVIYLMASTGSSILISQYLGAKKSEDASKIAQSAVLANIGLAIILSTLLYLLSDLIINSLGLEPQVRLFASDYFKVYVRFSIFQAVSLVFAGIVRSYGYSYIPLYVNIGANIINIIGNYLFIFGALGFPQLGVKGVAISTVFSQGAGAFVMMLIITRIPEINMFAIRKIKTLGTYIKDILKIGVPSAGEFLSYNLAQIVILYMVSSLGTASLASYTYTINFTRFAYMLSISLGNATQILVGYSVGSKDMDGAYKICLKNLKIGIISSLILAGTIAIFRFPLIKLVTLDPTITAITSTLLLLAVIHEIARPLNLVVIAGLRGAGDVKYPVFTGIIMMWSIAVTLAYLFGIKLGYAMAGIWIARLIEEWLRGGVILKRWLSRRWESKILV
ncbi:MATE family efflux transporter [Thiospirochaeta perfilievii]|uniref:MATE family efflux transporter n=1 Tax=Thiospirochaeta perfilievii TaxID=252967 RepID=A0A5C1QAA3_9SPIO|nr:MATE family efflux transporter [Thiospirochaeta perfilievii]QEN03849.1 MATE family efflux transporter [Thiospirochaeta perfilievii]